MDKWYRQWDDFINEQEEKPEDKTKLQSSGNVQDHFTQTLANLTSGQRTEISSELDNLFSDPEFKGLFNQYQLNSDSLELADKDFIGSAAEDFIRDQGLATDLDLPGKDAAIEFLVALKDKVGSPMSEEENFVHLGDNSPLSNSEFNEYTPSEFAMGVAAGRL